LDRLLADQLTKGEEEALETHVAGCSECQRRLDHLTRGMLTLPPRPASVLERVANLLPAQVWLLEQQYMPQGGIEAAKDPPPTPPPAYTPRPASGRPGAASLDPGGFLGQPEIGSPDVTKREPETPKPGGEPAAAGGTPAQPSAFGRYEVRRVLGSGGFGSVYLGHDTQLDRPVAIKVGHGSRDLPPAQVERFLQEARRLARLHHPGIVTVHDVGTHEGRIYIVSDFLDGPSLEEWLQANHPSWQKAARLAVAIADALAHAHARSIVHRDVKPANILLTANRTPVLVDFGLALDEAQAGGCQIGIVAGTPLYMSPEQVAGTAHRIDGRTDVYSLGVVLYEMLTGHVPFRAGETRELLRQVRDDEPQPPRQLVRGLPPELERVCLKALAKRPQDRYSTAADLAADLRRVAQAAAEPTTPPSAPASTLADERRRVPETPPSQRQSRDAERRQVTVLVCGCELFDSEEYVGGIDAEDQARLLRAFQQSCEQVARRFDGTIVQCNEQGLLVCFGYPVSYEDAARRAARTGFGILDDLKALGTQLGHEHHLELGPWVGIHTGLALVETSENAVSLVGEARNVAVRLKDAAERGHVVCTEATHRLIRDHFECASLGSRKLKGVPRPVALFDVRAAAAVANPLEARGDGLTPLIGRDQEVSLLLERWEQAREGMGQVVLLVGEPGLGKSRLVYTLKQHLQGQPDQAGEAGPELAGHLASVGTQAARDATIIEWRCSPYYQNTLLYPARDSLERFLGIGGEEVPAARFDRLVRHLAEYDLARPEVVPLFAALLSLPTDERFPSLGLSPVWEREETFWALQEWLLASAEQWPVLFVVEDLHWGDASTLEFLRQLLAEGLHDRVLTILTFRPEFQTPWPAVAHQTSLALNRLTCRQVGEMMRRELGVETLPEALVDLVYDRTGGVPLFVEEFAQVVQESGLLDRMEADGAHARALLAHETPASLQDLVMARLDRLSGDREVAQLSAVLGREFSCDLLAAVATLDKSTLQAELAKLVQGEILHQKGRWPRCNYTFKHALLQDSVYKTLVKGKRQQFHCRIAEVLEVRFPQTAQTQPELLAHHCTEAGLTEKAIGYWLQAGLRSRQRSAYVEAIGHLTQGLALLAKLSETPDRDAQELEFLNLLGSVYVAAQGYAALELGPIFRRARELCERIGQPTQLFTALRGAWVRHVVLGNFREYTQLAREAMELAERINDPGILMEALFLRGVTSFYRGEFADTRADCARAAADFDDRARTRFWAGVFGEDSGIVHRCFLALALWHLGYPDQALKANGEMLQLAHAIGQPCDLCLALIHKSLLSRHCRLATETLDAAEEAIRIATGKGLAFWHAAGTLLKAAALFSMDRRAEALTLFQKGSDAYRVSGFRAWLPFHLGTLGDAYTQAGRFHEAGEALEEGLVTAEKNNERFHQAELHRLKGELLLAASPEQPAPAEDCFRRAIDTSRRQQSRAWELRATMSLARLWQRQGRRDEARAALASVYGTYTEGFTTPDLMDARALLRDAGLQAATPH
jgi:class 3 adenylate cyclase/predicted ATPase